MLVTHAEHQVFLSIHGVNIRLRTDSCVLVEATSQLLGYFECRASHQGVLLEVGLTAVDHREQVPVQIPDTAKRLYQGSGIPKGDVGTTTWQCDIFADGGMLIADFHGEGLIVIDGSSRSAKGWIVRPERMSLDVRASFVHFVIVELAKRCGLFTFHATALEKDGKGVLIPGFSGRGKTTAFLSLLRSGYRYLSDDHPFFRMTEQGVELLPYPLKVNVTDRTVEFFPELREAPQSILRPGIPKRYFYAEELYPWPLGRPCVPRLILFPQVIDAPYSCLEPLSKKQALELILPHSLLVFDPVVAKTEFHALSRLVAMTDCYRLYFGRDVLELPQLVTPLLQVHTNSSGASA